jgi:toxin ParE1/3/4
VARKLIIRPTAETDLDSLYEYIARDSPRNAVEFTRRIRAKCAELVMFPERGTLREDLEPSLRILGFERRAVIAFRVLKKEVEVVRVLYGGRELERIFGDG